MIRHSAEGRMLAATGVAGTPRRLVTLAGAVSAVALTAALILGLHLVPAGWLLAAAFAGAGLAGLLVSLFEAERSPFDVLCIVASVMAAAALAAAVVALLGHDPRWLLLLPPGLWLPYQTYRYLRADGERRAWLKYAQVVKDLNQLDESAVALAGVTGALKIFGAERVQLDVLGVDGQRRSYCGDSGGVSEVPDAGGADGADGPRWSDNAEGTVIRSLVVGAEEVGELRVTLPRSVLIQSREHAVLSAFSDALAAALHDAVAHQERATLAARSSYAAVHDSLTHLSNRAALLRQGDLVLHQLDHDRPVALIVLDIDNFKEVNETLGHNAGDQLLKLAAERLRDLSRPGELLARIGGDEFALLFTAVAGSNPTQPVGQRAALMPFALRRARQIAELLAVNTEVVGVKMSAETSVGVVVAEAGAVDMAELLRRADIALHRAKEVGSIASYDSAQEAASTDQLTLLAELREALATEDQLVLALQPAVELSAGAPTGVEALIRWHHPRRGKLNPADFIRAVENSELLAPFTRYVIDKALKIAAAWARHGLLVPISVNLSARSLLDPRLPAEIAALLRRYRLPAQRLVLEITETVEMSEQEVIDEVLGALRALGVQLAVDDFGTGFSSLAFLIRVPVNELKVDRSFVMRMADSPEAAAIVRATVALGRELGLRVVAEGVETAEQRAALAALGCAAAQGYHFFKPMSAEQVMGVLRSLPTPLPRRS